MITLGIMLFAAFNTYASGNIVSNDGSIEKTYIKNNKRMPDLAYQAGLRQGVAWQNFLQKHSTWYVEFNEENAKPHRAYGKPIPAFGSDAESKAVYFITTELSDFNIPVNDLRLTNVNVNSKFQYINFHQTYQSLEVINSNLTFRITHDGKVAMFGIDVFNNISVDINPAIDSEAIIDNAQSGITDNIVNISVEPGLKILPVASNGIYEFHLVYEVTVETTGEIPGKYYTLIDAHTGDVLYRQNRVHTTINLTLEGTITNNPNTATYVAGLPDAKVVINAITYYTDLLGNLTTADNTSVTANFALEGLYAIVYKGQTGSNLATFSATLNPGSNTVSFDANADDTEISAFYHTNQIHEHLKTWTPAGFTSMDNPMEVRVDRTDGDCNAFYDGGINFYAPGGGCPASALFDDVIYHEYAHGINYIFYSYLGGSFGNSALGEGYSDVWAFTLTENPVLALGFSGPVSSYIRRYDIDPKVYPQDLVGESHADGEIIAGAWWDLGQNLDSIPQMMDIFIGTHYATLSEPDGNEGVLYRDVLLEALLYDDDDADLTNGTPNGVDICGAFGIHGITLISNANLTHTPVDTSLANVPIAITATLNISSTTYLGDVLLFYRINTNPTWNTVVMTDLGGFNYTGDIPAQSVGTVISYYLGVGDNICGNLSAIIPIGAAESDPNIPYYILVGYDLKATEDFEGGGSSWSYGMPGDLATTGMWEVTIPLGSWGTPGNPSTMVAPDYQHTPGGQLCAVTQRASSATDQIGEYDVDGGHTTLESSVFDLSSYSNPVFTYFRWYINNPPSGANPNADWWQVQVSNDGTNWVAVEGTKVSDRSWRRFAFRVQDYITPSATTQIRFIASDSIRLGQYLDGGSLVEAALDDLQLWDVELSVDIGNDTAICGGDAIELDAGNPGATYLWSTGATTQTITVTSSDTIWVTVNSIASDTVIITVPPLLNLSTSFNSPGCGNADGTATVMATGGNTPYTYLWDDTSAQITATATGLTAGIYTVTVTDALGCDTTATISVSSAPAVSVSISSSSNPSSCGVNDGNATVLASGGTPPFTYLWTPGGQTTPTADSLGAGIYTVNVTDSKGCSDMTTVDISDPGAATLSVSTISMVSCFGGNNGSATVSASGGVLPYTYLWLPAGGADSIATGLPALTYTVNVTDSVGCQSSIIVDITQPDALALSTSVTDVSCFGDTDGKVSVAVSGGTSAYTYLWNTTAAIDSISGLSPGTYFVIVTDANLCIDSVTNIIVDEPAVLTITLTGKQNESVAGLNDGTMSVSVSGGTNPYTYNWSPAPGSGQGTDNITNLFPGTYTVTVTDNNGCDTTYTDIILAGPVGITEFDNNVIFGIYPNPTNGQFIVEFSNQKKDDYLIEVKNIIGQLIYTGQVNNISENFTKQIDLSKHNQGVYFLSISNSSGTRTEKLIVY